jgi:hypothetical protein
MKEGEYNNIQKKGKTCFVMVSQAWKEIGYQHNPLIHSSAS